MADRLSKPTAASLSKARTSPAAPTRGKTAPAARGGARGGKPKAFTKKPGKSDTPAAVVAPEPEPEPEPTQEHINGHGIEPSQSTEAEEEHSEQQEEEEHHREDVNIVPSEEVEEQEEQHHNGHDVYQETVHDKKTDNDIEDIVNFLEAPPRIRPSSAASIPDEVNDIPDEE